MLRKFRRDGELLGPIRRNLPRSRALQTRYHSISAIHGVRHANLCGRIFYLYLRFLRL